MFSRSAFYHPYKRTARFSPAGFRIADYLSPKKCFHLFQGRESTETRPGSDLVHPGGDTFQTICPADLDAREETAPSRLGPNYARNTTPNNTKNSTRTKDSFSIPFCRKGHRRPKHLSTCPPNRRSQQLKEKRATARRRILDCHERRLVLAREGFRGLRRDAKMMEPEYMTQEDQIFLHQLASLQLDQVWQHDLEGHRKQMWRAAEEWEERRHAHVKRDKEAAKLTSLTGEALKEREKKVAEAARIRSEERKERLRKREAAAVRADEARQRAHQEQERKLREKQEYLFREELARKAREEEEELRRQEEYRRQEMERQRQEEVRRHHEENLERFLRAKRDRALKEEQERQAQAQAERERKESEHRARERKHRTREGRESWAKQEREYWGRQKQERWAREEQDRQARHFAEQAAQDEQFRQYFAIYEAKWDELRTNNSLGPIDVREMPWPIFGVIVSAEQITYQDVRSFLFHPLQLRAEGKTTRDKVKSEVLRFHPDKFNTRIAPKIQPSQQALAREIAGAVARILTQIMTDEERQG